MRQFITKRITRHFVISMVWLIIPLYFILIPLIQENISKAEDHLTPYSVNVSSYERADGSYVASYSRRPPGSVEHDKPYEKQIREFYWEIYFLTVISIVSAVAFALLTFNEFLNKKENYIRYVESEINSKMDIDLIHLNSKPNYLINRNISRFNYTKTYKCKICKRNILSDEFHASSLAVRNPSKVCLDCMTLDTIKYLEGIKYASEFQDSMEKFITEFENLNGRLHPDGLIDKKQIKKIFYQKIKDIRIR